MMHYFFYLDITDDSAHYVFLRETVLLVKHYRIVPSLTKMCILLIKYWKC